MSHFSKLTLAVVLLTSWVCLGQNSLAEFSNLPSLQEELYGSGALLQLGKTYYITLQGDDKNDGLALDSAWRSINLASPKLQAGDTLLIAEGEYEEGREIQLNVKDYSNGYDENCGRPGRPIRIQALPNQRVLIRGGVFLPAEKIAAGMRYTYQIPYSQDQFACIWEAGTQNKLEYSGSLEKTEELPGTYFYDSEKKMLYVRFTAAAQPAQPGIRIQRGRVAMRIHGSYIQIKGLWFANYGDAMMIRPNYTASKPGERSYGENLVQHVTIEECGFYANSTLGIQAIAMQWCLFKNNYGNNNALRGGLMLQTDLAQDNLIIGNVYGSCRDTRRLEGNHVHHLISQYGGVGQRNHIINNVLDDLRSFRWKPVCPGSRFEGNYLAGNLAVESGMTTELVTSPEQRLIVRHNIIRGNIYWGGNDFDNSKTTMDRYDPDKVFLNNFLGRHEQANMDSALFADPSYYDFRLQAGSPLQGAGVSGLDLGLPTPKSGRVLFAGSTGKDQNSGDSVQNALLNPQVAVDRLSPGDTLYILPGKYDLVLRITRGGSESQPIRIRAHAKKDVWFNAVQVTAPWVEIAGLSVVGAPVGYDLSAADITLRSCGAYQCQEAGIKAVKASRLALYSCTMADNQAALAFNDTQDAQVRDSIIAGNQTVLTAELAEQSTLRSSHNIIAGGNLPGYSNWQVQELNFADPAKNDYRLQWDSPAAACDSFCAPAGARPVLAKPLLISNVKVDYLTTNTGVAFWETPEDDSFGNLEYWPQGESKRARCQSLTQGTRHAAGLTDLSPDTTYEYRIRSNGRRGNTAISEVFSFRTTSTQPPAKTYYVSPDGNDTADGLSLATAWQTLRQVSLAVCAGDTVLLQPGKYYDALAPIHGGKPGQPIIFRKNGPGQVIIDGQDVLFQLLNMQDLQHLEVDGLTFINPEKGCRKGIITLHRCNDLKIVNCRMGVDKVIDYNSGPFLRATNCRNLHFENNLGWGGDYPLVLGDCTDVVLKNNTIVDATMMGSHIYNSSNLSIINNLWCRPCIPNKSNECLLFSNIQPESIVCDYNLFYSPYPTHKVGQIRAANASPQILGSDLAEWQANSPFDKNSIQADPLFYDYEKGDFRLRPGSPAIGAGKNGENIGATLPE